MSGAIVHEGANLSGQALQSKQTMQKYIGWMGALLPVRLHMQQYRYILCVVSPPDSHFPQLHFNLTDATHWNSHYNGFSYEEFYEFIVDFFEADTTPEAQEASTKLLDWWNRYVSRSIITSATTNTEYPQSSVSKVCSHPWSHIRISTTSLPRDRSTSTPGCLFI